MTTAWDVDAIRAKLAASDVMVERSLVRLFAWQTSDEQEQGVTSHTNGRGFNSVDAKFLSSLARQVSRSNGYSEGRKLSPKQLVWARKKLSKYAGQLASIANEHNRAAHDAGLGATIIIS